MVGSEKKHNYIVSHIYNTPGLIGLDHRTIIFRKTEHGLDINGTRYVTPDILFINESLQRLFVEVKSSNNQKLYSKGMRQLEKMLQWHERAGMNTPDALLVMPRQKYYKHLPDCLDDLARYRMGDNYSQPF